jgi:hypothetical protein
MFSGSSEMDAVCACEWRARDEERVCEMESESGRGRRFPFPFVAG